MRQVKLLYKGVDIYADIHVSECVYENYIINHLPKLRIVFDNSDYEFDTWSMKQNDSIRLLDDGIDTGRLYVNSIHPHNAGYELTASPLKALHINQRTTKEWKKITFRQVMEELAKRHTLQASFYGITTNQTYSYLLQNNERDFAFASRIATLEGCCIVLYNDTMIVAKERYLEGLEASEMEIDEYLSCNITSTVPWSKCTVSDGNKIQASYQNEKANIIGGEFYSVIDLAESKVQVERYARNLLRHRNKNCYSGVLVSDELLQGYSAGSVVNIVSSDYPTAEGKAIIFRLRHDLVNGKSKVWFRKCLEGY